MRRNIVKVLALSTIIVLVSCGRDDKVSGNLYLGDGFTNENAMVLSYNVDEVLSSGSRISGTLSKQENTELKSTYTLAYTSTSPLSSESYVETTIIVWDKDMFESNTEVKYDIELDIEKVFANKDLESTVYFVLHGDDFEVGKVSTFAYTEFRYRWDNDKVKLILEY